MESRENKGSVKIWELDSDLRYLHWLSCWVRYTDESSDSSRPIGILSMYSCSAALSFVCFLRPVTLAFVSFFVLAILPDQLQEKPSYGKILSLPLSALRHTRGFWRFARKFHHKKINGSKLSKRWLAQLSENPVERVCGRSFFAKQEIFLRAVFSSKFFRLKQKL